jgi:hypothetical protein
MMLSLVGNCRAFAAMGAVCLSLGLPPAFAESSTAVGLKSGAVYGEIRPAILKAGWKPFRDALDISVCKQNDVRCAEYPETVSCDDDAAATCKFTWLRETQEMDVTTIGQKPRVSSVDVRFKGKAASLEPRRNEEAMADCTSHNCRP